MTSEDSDSQAVEEEEEENLRRRMDRVEGDEDGVAAADLSAGRYPTPQEGAVGPCWQFVAYDGQSKVPV